MMHGNQPVNGPIRKGKSNRIFNAELHAATAPQASLDAGRRVAVFLFAVFLLCTTSNLLAADGKALLTEKCGQCHGSMVSKVEPGKYTAEQWQQFFDKNRHAAYVDIRARFTPEELNAIKTYLMQSASDAGKPKIPGAPQPNSHEKKS